VDVEEIDAASNRGVDEIRQLRDKVQYAPTNLARKVYIIDEVHMLTTEAFNALLKTLEEPPSHALFILATTEPHKIPSTIVSRCQRFDFRRIAPDLMVQHLAQVCAAEGWTSQTEALWKIAMAADGGLRDALGILEQTAAFGGGNITTENAAYVMGGVESQQLLQLIVCLWRQEVTQALQLLGQWYDNGKDAGRIVHELLQLFRDLVIVKLSAPTSLPLHLQIAGLREAGGEMSVPWLMQGVAKLGEVYTNLRYLDDARLALETTLLLLQPNIQEPATRTTVRTHETEPVTAHSSGSSVNGAGVGPESSVSPQESRTEQVASESPGSRPRANSETRKREVLKQLLENADAGELQRIRGLWDEVLQQVKSARVQTHAWLLNGDAVLATGSVVVITFSSKFHRDTIMKPEERKLVESALSAAAQTPQQIFAILRQDWEKYGAPGAQEPPREPDLVETALRAFGKDRVEIIDGE